MAAAAMTAAAAALAVTSTCSNGSSLGYARRQNHVSEATTTGPAPPRQEQCWYNFGPTHVAHTWPKCEPSSEVAW